MKKAVMVPIETDDDGMSIPMDNEFGPFYRGVLQFDDYNYRVINPFLLLPKPEEKKKLTKQERKAKKEKDELDPPDANKSNKTLSIK